MQAGRNGLEVGDGESVGEDRERVRCGRTHVLLGVLQPQHHAVRIRVRAQHGHRSDGHLTSGLIVRLSKLRHLGHSGRHCRRHAIVAACELRKGEQGRTSHAYRATAHLTIMGAAQQLEHLRHVRRRGLVPQRSAGECGTPTHAALRGLIGESRQVRLHSRRRLKL